MMYPTICCSTPILDLDWDIMKEHIEWTSSLDF